MEASHLGGDVINIPGAGQQSQMWSRTEYEKLQFMHVDGLISDANKNSSFNRTNEEWNSCLDLRHDSDKLELIDRPSNPMQM